MATTPLSAEIPAILLFPPCSPLTNPDGRAGFPPLTVKRRGGWPPWIVAGLLQFNVGLAMGEGLLFRDELNRFTVTPTPTHFLLSIEGATADNGRWLGLTLYPPLYGLATWTVGRIEPLKSGRFQVDFSLPLTHLGGNFDVAIWENCYPYPTASALVPLLGSVSYQLDTNLYYRPGTTFLKAGSFF